MIRALAAIALIAATVAAHAQTAPVQVTPAEQSAIDLALARGRLIYAYDQAAWHGTDDMLAKVEHPETKVRAWIVDGPAESPTLIFFDKDEADPHAVYIAEFRDNKLVSSRVLGPNDDRTLSPQRKAMILARDRGMEAWQAAKPVYCSDKHPNTVVLPPERPGGPFLVYVMTPQTENGIYPTGGHFRVEISADGKAGASRSFTNSCLTVGPAPKGSTFLFVTHLLDPVPTEMHVFTVLAANLPIIVGTSADRAWVVDGKTITPVDLKKK
jgi:hypothetical protein